MNYISCRPNWSDVDGEPVALQRRQGGNPQSSIMGYRTSAFTPFAMVHGYNCAELNCCDAYRANSVIAKECDSRFPSEMDGILWPGLGDNPVESLEFHRAQRQADLSSAKLAEYLNLFSPGVVMAHSLGARVALEAACKHGAKIKLLVLIGAAVADDCFNVEYREANRNIDLVLNFHSKRDNVLGQAFMLDQFSRALGHDGPRATAPPWVKDWDVTNSVGSHSQYRYVRDIWWQIGQHL